MSKTVKPGANPPQKGKYKPIKKNGKRGKGPNITITGEEKHMPPTKKPGETWEKKK